ncbi:MAG: hypothetical protein Q9208_008100 [Pyrenodesmia sp. 3 TL-2023]
MASSLPSPQISNPSNPRPFLSLPDVIRERIYFYVLTIDIDPGSPWITPTSTIRKVSTWNPDKYKLLPISKARPSSLSILATCRTILVEAFHLWYKNNTLNFCSPQDLVDFLYSCGLPRAQEIRSIRLDLSVGEWIHEKARYSLGSLVRLEKLIFVFNAWTSCNHETTNWVLSRRPKILGRLGPLQDVTFTDPSEERMMIKWQTGGCPANLKFGISDAARYKMDEWREKLMTTKSSKSPRSAPPMVDLFARLRLRNQRGKDTIDREWEEDFSYAPDIDGLT